MAWTYLILAGLFEVGFTTSLKFSEGFTRLAPSLAFLVTSGLSFWLLTRALQTIPLGTAYAVWTGLGAVGTAIVGILVFKDPATFGRLFFLALIIASVVGLKLVSSE
ncbi:MAG: multidrug efflux SMR transporter [Alphaproteobacteria bacterium]|jgi:quaternary ammonium compound-resistance protein SugE|nr:multidrug efflux SMR transporter [Alphaproteobacteria bacterium]|tara:strand:+ start:265 stop:585 length:321 start_codon:yes stop_codon:yes gene_type:complete